MLDFNYLFDDVDTHDICDDADDTLRFAPLDLDFDGDTDPDATSIWDLGSEQTFRRSAARRRLIRDTQQEIAGLCDALAAGWDVGPELAHQKRRLVELVAADRRAA